MSSFSSSSSSSSSFFFFFFFFFCSTFLLLQGYLRLFCVVVKFDSKKWMAFVFGAPRKWRERREGETRVGHESIMLFHSSLDPRPVIPELPEAVQENKCPSLRVSLMMIIPAPIRGLSPYIASRPGQ